MAVEKHQGCRVIAINPVTAKWEETEAVHLTDLGDPKKQEERLRVELQKMMDDLVKDA